MCRFDKRRVVHFARVPSSILFHLHLVFLSFLFFSLFIFSYLPIYPCLHSFSPLQVPLWRNFSIFLHGCFCHSVPRCLLRRRLPPRHRSGVRNLWKSTPSISHLSLVIRLQIYPILRIMQELAVTIWQMRTTVFGPPSPHQSEAMCSLIYIQRASESGFSFSLLISGCLLAGCCLSAVAVSAPHSWRFVLRGPFMIGREFSQRPPPSVYRTYHHSPTESLPPTCL